MDTGVDIGQVAQWLQGLALRTELGVRTARFAVQELAIGARWCFARAARA